MCSNLCNSIKMPQNMNKNLPRSLAYDLWFRHDAIRSPIQIAFEQNVHNPYGGVLETQSTTGSYRVMHVMQTGDLRTHNSIETLFVSQ